MSRLLTIELGVLYWAITVVPRRANAFACADCFIFYIERRSSHVQQRVEHHGDLQRPERVLGGLSTLAGLTLTSYPPLLFEHKFRVLLPKVRSTQTIVGVIEPSQWFFAYETVCSRYVHHGCIGFSS